jgi:hypothetical protein
MEPEWAAVWVAAGSLLVAAIALVAAALSAKYARDQRDLARQAQATLELEREQRAWAPWALEHFQNDAFALTNRGAAVLFDVVVLIESWPLREGQRKWEMVDPAAAITFLVPAVEALPASPPVLVVWADEAGGELRTWRTVLPARR